MSDQPAPSTAPPPLAALKARRKAIINVNEAHEKGLSPIDRLAVQITDRVGTMGFFFVIFVWTVLWCGYNILASEVSSLHWKAFDPFPAFVAYLLISNVIQILLMPLIMVGQNVQGRHSELRAQSDFEINCKAETEVEAILAHLEYQQEILLQMAQAQGIKLEALLSRVKST